MADIFGTSDDDTLNGTGGADLIEGYEGNDIIYGNGGDDIIVGGAGMDAVFGGAGNDTFLFFANDDFAPGDSFDGGAGTDTFRITLLAQGFLLSSLSYTRVERLVIETVVDTLGVTAAELNGFQTIEGWFNLLGTGAVVLNPGLTIGPSRFDLADTITSMTFTAASATAVIVNMGLNGGTVNAGASNDTVNGGLGNDIINGGDGDNKIMALAGADILTGGTGADQFRYILAGDSGLGTAADRITDFATGQDLLSFLLLDADLATAGDQVFGFIGTAAFANTGIGQIRYSTSGADLIVQADSDGNGVADMDIVLQGRGGSTLTAADFIL